MIEIEKTSHRSIQQQLYDRILNAIVAQQMLADERLPSARSLAAQLSIARGTVELAYARLASDGYIVARGQRGTFVSPNGDRDLVATITTPGSAAATSPNLDEYMLPFRFGVPGLDLFPRKVWARLAARRARTIGMTRLIYPDPVGLAALREAIVIYLAVSRGVACRPDQIVITTGYQGAINLVAHLILTPGDFVWLEDPGYGFAQDAFQALAMRIAPIPVDDEGICVEIGRSRYPRAPLAVVTPAHQFPLGVTLSPARRRALLAWADSQNSWLLEDDYDCEFHYSGQRPSALKSIDCRDRVFYAGSFSKTLFPGLRLGYLVVPERFTDAAKRACRVLHRGASVLDQSIVAEFMAEGHFARHLRKMRTHYATRRRALTDALQEQFGRDVEVVAQAGGMHILARFPRLGPDVELAQRALAHGLMPHALSAQSIEHDAGSGLLMSFTHVHEQDAAELVSTLHRAIV